MERLIFPLFNTLATGIFGALIGYYIGELGNGILLGAIAGFLAGLVFEYLTGLAGSDHWLYRRRVLLLILLEIPILLFVVGPYAYVLQEMRPNPHEVCCQTPLDYGASAYEDVVIQTEDGISLVGWYVPPEDESGALIILLHGARGDRMGTAWHAEQLIEAGYGVLMYDQRALGESSGDTVSFGWLDWRDLLAVVEFAGEQPDVDPERIGAVGLSGGGHIALNAVYHDPRLKAVLIDGLQSQRIDDFPTPEGAGEQFALLINNLILQMAQLRLGMEAPPAFIEMIPAVDVPMLLIAGELDDFEYRVNQKYRAVAGPNIEVWIIPGAYHVGGPGLVPEAYKQRMLNFFKVNLKGEPYG